MCIASACDTVKVWTVAGEAIAELKLDGARVSNCCSFSPDGRWLATFVRPTKEGENAYLALWSTATWQIAKRTPEQTMVHWPNEFAWSPDSKWLCSIWQSVWLCLWDIDNNRWSALRNVQGIESLACDPGFREVVVSQEDRLLWFGDPKTGKTVRQFAFSTLRNIRVAIQPTDGRVALCRNDVRMISSEGQQVWTKEGLPWATDAMWSPDGRWLALASDDRTIRLWTPDGEPGSVLEGHTGDVQFMAWHPESKQLLSGGKDCTVRSWQVTGEGQTLLQLDEGTSIERIEWSPKGDRFRVRSQTTDGEKLSLWDKEGKPIRELLSEKSHSFA
jgi:WD40 repeat protein